jgi:hypothetical protein
MNHNRNRNLLFSVPTLHHRASIQKRFLSPSNILCAITKGEVYVEETNDVAANRKTSLATETSLRTTPCVHQFHKHTHQTHRQSGGPLLETVRWLLPLYT